MLSVWEFPGVQETPSMAKKGRVKGHIIPSLTPWEERMCPSHIPLNVPTALKQPYNSGMVPILPSIPEGKFIRMYSEPCSFKHGHIDFGTFYNPAPEKS